MSRDLDSSLAAALSNGAIMPAFLLQLTFASETVAAWTGIGTLVYDTVSYLGVGSLGNISMISEGSDVRADGTVVTLSGVDPSYLTEALTDIQLGAPAKVYFGLLSNGALIGAPYLVFSGTVDKPSIKVGTDKITISLALENRLVNLQRASQRRYTAADQHLAFPTDIGLNWVEILNDIAVKWG